MEKEMLGYSLHLLSAAVLSGTALDSAGDAAVEGGEAGFSLSKLASALWTGLVALAKGNRIGGPAGTYLKALVCCVVGGVPVRDEAPESSPGRPREPPGPSLRPLLLRELNMEVGPREMLPLAALLVEPFRRRRSSIPTWLD